jgi:hypothetical protein
MRGLVASPVGSAGRYGRRGLHQPAQRGGDSAADRGEESGGCGRVPVGITAVRPAATGRLADTASHPQVAQILVVGQQRQYGRPWDAGAGQRCRHTQRLGYQRLHGDRVGAYLHERDRLGLPGHQASEREAHTRLAENDGRLRRVHLRQRPVDLLRWRWPVPGQPGQPRQPVPVALAAAARRPDRRAQVVGAPAVRQPGVELALVEPGRRAERIVAEQLPAAPVTHRGVPVRPAAHRAYLIHGREVVRLAHTHANSR